VYPLITDNTHVR